MRISEVLDQQDGPAREAGRRRPVVTVTPDAAVRELLSLLTRHDVGALIVRESEAGPVAGIVSERDVVRRLHDDEGVLDSTVGEIMTAVVHTCAPTDSLDDVMTTMTQHRVRHVPVLEDDALTGIVSIGDVVKSRISQLEFERDQLDSYVRQP